MRLFDMFKKTRDKSPAEKLETVKKFVKDKTQFLMNDDFKDLNPELKARKAIYQEVDKAIREKLTSEQAVEHDKIEERRSVLEELKKEASEGVITEKEFKTILESDEFKKYMEI